MTAGLPLFLLVCFFPAAIYVTQPSRFLGLALVGLFAVVVVLLPSGRRRG